mmetsp:Transcript_796/g.1951  ORF Transcript_796/g.1951 Transcript_796/m.1951 type:complete len:336 (-) Transcript_796:3107-4114(-)
MAVGSSPPSISFGVLYRLVYIPFDPRRWHQLWYFDRRSHCDLRSNPNHRTIYWCQSHREAFSGGLHKRRRKTSPRKGLLQLRPKNCLVGNHWKSLLWFILEHVESNLQRTRTCERRASHFRCRSRHRCRSVHTVPAYMPKVCSPQPHGSHAPRCIGYEGLFSPVGQDGRQETRRHLCFGIKPQDRMDVSQPRGCVRDSRRGGHRTGRAHEKMYVIGRTRAASRLHHSCRSTGILRNAVPSTDQRQRLRIASRYAQLQPPRGEIQSAYHLHHPVEFSRNDPTPDGGLGKAPGPSLSQRGDVQRRTSRFPKAQQLRCLLHRPQWLRCQQHFQHVSGR